MSKRAVTTVSCPIRFNRTGRRCKGIEIGCECTNEAGKILKRPHRARVRLANGGES